MSKSNTQLAVDQLKGQHALHGILGSVFERVGGEDFVADWAEDNPGAFIKLLFGATPSMQPVASIQGDVVLHVHSTLGPTALDGEVVSEQ